MDIAIKVFSFLFVIWFLIAFLLIVHETGHMIVLAKQGMKIDKVIVGNVKLFALNIGGVRHEFGLFPFFAYLISNDYAKATHDKRMAVAIAGPITSIALGLLLFGYNAISPGWFTEIAASASIALGLWNLIPLPPMDGWPVLEWHLNKRNITISHRARMVLLMGGITTVSVLAVLAH